MDQTGSRSSTALTTTYIYSGDGTTLPSQVNNSDGGTTTYSYDSYHRVVSETSTFEDDYLKTNAYYYIGNPAFANLSCDNTNYWPLEPRLVSESNPNSPDGGKNTYFVALSSNITVTCVAPGNSGPFTAGSLSTTNIYYPDGDPNATKLQCVKNPDGTVQLYYYANSDPDFGLGYQTNTVFSGQPNNGTKTVTVLGNVGQVLSQQVYDIAPSHQEGMLIDQKTYVYTDVLNRSYICTYLDGTTDTVQYDCCGISSMTDRNGVTTVYAHDALKRQTAATQFQFNIMTANVLDAAGNQLATTRTADTTITLQQSAYDDAGRVILQTNVLGGVTSYAYSIDDGGHRVTTTTYPKTTYPTGGTRI